jgi:hypothetical protein
MSRSEVQVNDPLAVALEEAPRTLDYLQWLRREADPIVRADPERYFALIDPIGATYYLREQLIVMAFIWNRSIPFSIELLRSTTRIWSATAI